MEQITSFWMGWVALEKGKNELFSTTLSYYKLSLGLLVASLAFSLCKFLFLLFFPFKKMFGHKNACLESIAVDKFSLWKKKVLSLTLFSSKISVPNLCFPSVPRVASILLSSRQCSWKTAASSIAWWMVIRGNRSEMFMYSLLSASSKHHYFPSKSPHFCVKRHARQQTIWRWAVY